MTELQQALMDHIHAFSETRREGPATADVQREFRYRHEGSVLRALEGLAAAGHLVHVAGRWQLRTPAVQLHFQLGGEETHSAPVPPR